MIKLSDFLSDMRDSEVKVAVTEKQLRQFTQQSFGWENLAKEQGKTIEKLTAKIVSLEARLEMKSLNKCQTINLFA